MPSSVGKGEGRGKAWSVSHAAQLARSVGCVLAAMADMAPPRSSHEAYALSLIPPKAVLTQQVKLIHIQDAAVCLRQQARLEHGLALLCRQEAARAGRLS